MAIDKELLNAVKQAIDGDENGFNYIYKATYSYVFSRCRMIMKNDEDASELLQETYIAAYKSLDKIVDVNSIFSWLGSIAYNQGMKMFRKRKDVLLDEDGESLFDVQENADVSTMPGYEMEIKEIADIIKDIIDELPEPQRAVVMAYYYDEMSVNDIADMMEVSAGTIKSRLNYARKHIEESVNEKEKKFGIKLHTLVAPVLCSAIGLKLSAISISEKTAEKLYIGICTKSGIAALSTLEAANSGTIVSGTLNTVSEEAAATVGDNIASATGVISKSALGAAEAATGKAVGVTLASTLVKTVAAIVLVGVGTAGVLYYNMHNDKKTDSTADIEATTEVMSNISDAVTENISNSDDRISTISNENNSDDDVSDKEAEKDRNTNDTEEAEGTAIDNTESGTTENSSTENNSIDDPDIESVEQDSVTTQATTQATTRATTQQKTEKKSTKKQEVEFDDMEF